MCTLPITGGGIMDYKANIPIYLQVIDDIKKRILTGEIKLGDKLPSARDLRCSTVSLTLLQEYTMNLNSVVCAIPKEVLAHLYQDVHLIDTLKAELSSEMIETFISGMTSLGFSKDEIINLIKNYHE